MEEGTSSPSARQASATAVAAARHTLPDPRWIPPSWNSLNSTNRQPLSPLPPSPRTHDSRALCWLLHHQATGYPIEPPSRIRSPHQTPSRPSGLVWQGSQWISSSEPAHQRQQAQLPHSRTAPTFNPTLRTPTNHNPASAHMAPLIRPRSSSSKQRPTQRQTRILNPCKRTTFTPARRPQSAKAVAAQLRGHQEEGHTHARSREQEKKEGQSHPARWGSGPFRSASSRRPRTGPWQSLSVGEEDHVCLLFPDACC